MTPLTVPEAPIGLDVHAGDGFAALSWLAPMGDGGAEIKGYDVYCSGSPEAKVCVKRNLTSTQFNITGLMDGQSYYLWVSAYNIMGEGQKGGPLIAIPIKRPGGPLNLTCIAGDRYVALNWSPPSDLGGVPWVNYTLLKGSSETSLVPTITNINSTSYNFTGLKNGQTYYFAVMASNPMGEGPLSDTVNAQPFSAPSEPRGLSATGGNGFVILGWSQPLSDGGRGITGYAIYRGVGLLSMERIATVGKVMAYNDTTALNNITYYYAVCALNAAGEGQMSSKVPGAPVYVPPVKSKDDDNTGDDVVDPDDKDSDGLNDSWEMGYFHNLTY
ncbi:MAG TPA: fibronectin type III domain-containing protein, partial [Methanocella sp.]|nr:fibronectin type III domain-containing protein [Methanocella sp.]